LPIKNTTEKERMMNVKIQIRVKTKNMEMQKYGKI